MNNTCFPAVCRQNKAQVLQFNSNMKTIKLLVNVTNFPSQGKLAEDAHQAMLNITIPEALRYSGVRSNVRPLGGSRQLRNVHVLVVHTHIMCSVAMLQFYF